MTFAVPCEAKSVHELNKEWSEETEIQTTLVLFCFISSCVGGCDKQFRGNGPVIDCRSRCVQPKVLSNLLLHHAQVIFTRAEGGFRTWCCRWWRECLLNRGVTIRSERWRKRCVHAVIQACVGLDREHTLAGRMCVCRHTEQRARWRWNIVDVIVKGSDSCTMAMMRTTWLSHGGWRWWKSRLRCRGSSRR